MTQRHITAEMTKHRQADLLGRVNQSLCSSSGDAPDVLAAGLRARLDDDLAGMLDDIMSIYHQRGVNNEEALQSAEWLVNAAAKLQAELE